MYYFSLKSDIYISTSICPVKVLWYIEGYMKGKRQEIASLIVEFTTLSNYDGESK